MSILKINTSRPGLVKRKSCSDLSKLILVSDPIDFQDKDEFRTMNFNGSINSVLVFPNSIMNPTENIDMDFESNSYGLDLVTARNLKKAKINVSAQKLLMEMFFSFISSNSNLNLNIDRFGISQFRFENYSLPCAINTIEQSSSG